MNIYDLFITTVAASGAVKIVSINIVALGALLIPAIQYITKVIKERFDIEKKAWIPITLGVVGFVATGLSTGQIIDIKSGAIYVIGGLCSGGIAASVRNIYAGK